MNHKTQPDEKEYAEVLANMLKNEASYIEIQNFLSAAKEYDIEKVRRHLAKMVPEDLLVQHDLEIELERLSYQNHHPKPDAAFGTMIKNIHADLNLEGLLTEKESRPIRKLFVLFSKYKWAVAATFLGLIGLFWLWEKQSSTSSETLFAANFEPFPEEYSTVIEEQLKGFGAALNLDRLVVQKEILAAYSVGDYAKTIALSKDYFEKYPPIGLEGDEEINLYLGISYLEQRQSGKAIEVLKPLAKNITFPEQTAAQWYLALAWIKQKEFNKAKVLLQIISQDNSSMWQSKAKELIKKLERFPKK